MKHTLFVLVFVFGLLTILWWLQSADYEQDISNTMLNLAQEKDLIDIDVVSTSSTVSNSETFQVVASSTSEQVVTLADTPSTSVNTAIPDAQTKHSIETQITSSTSVITEEAVAEMIMTGKLSFDDFEAMEFGDDFDLEPYHFVPFLNLRRVPYENVAGKLSVPIKKSTLGKGMGFDIEVDEDVLDIYAFDQNNGFVGDISVPQPNGHAIRMRIENIHGASLSNFAGDMHLRVSGGSGPLTLFLVGRVLQMAVMHVSIINESERQEYVFPTSQNMRGSVIIDRSDNGFTINKWNFDFDNDGVTDISVGRDGFATEDYMKIYDVMSNDKKLSANERKMIIDAKTEYIESLN